MNRLLLTGPRPWLLVFGLALGVRALYLLAWSDTPLWSALIGDGRGYDEWARAIAAGDWLGDEVFYQAPLYPYLMGALYWIVGPEAGVLRVVQILLGSASCVLLGLAGARLFSRPAGLVTALMLALYAPALYYDGLVQKASLGGFLLVLALWLLVEFDARQFDARRRWPWIAGVGLTLAAYALVRENALLLLPLLLCWILTRPDPGRLRASVALGLAAALLLLPVAARNFSLGGGLQLTTSQLGPNLYIGNHEGATGRYLPLRAGRGSSRYERIDAIEIAEAARGRELTPGDVSAYWVERTVDDIARVPLDWLRVLAAKFRLIWSAEELMDGEAIGVYADESVLLRVLGWFFHFGTLLPLAVVGLFATRGDARRLWPLWGVIAVMALGPLLFYVNGRYRYPLVPGLALFAGVGLLEGVRLLRTRDWNAAALPACLLVGVALFSNWPLGLVPDARSGAYLNLGIALKELGRHDDALLELGRAKKLWPESPEVHLQLGHVQLFSNDLEAAQASFAESVRLRPDDVAGLIGLGMVHSARSEPREALERYRQALILDPENVDANNNYAGLLALQGRWSEALAHFRGAARARPDLATIRINVATAEFEVGEPQAAFESYRAALALDPELRSAYYGSGRALEALGRRGAAAGVFSQLLAEPGVENRDFVGDALTRLADFRATCREPDIRHPAQALQLAEAARRVGPEFLSLSALAAARAAAGQFDLAVGSSEAALRLSEGGAVPEGQVLRERERLSGYRGGQAAFQDCPI